MPNPLAAMRRMRGHFVAAMGTGTAPWIMRVAIRRATSAGDEFVGHSRPVQIEPSRPRAAASVIKPLTGHSSGRRDRAVVVAMSLVGMMQVALYKIVGMTAVRNRFMTARSPVSVCPVVRATGMTRGTTGRIRPALS